MRLIKKLDKVNHDFQGVYECETCHGVRIDEGLDSYDDANFYENVIPEMHCYLCDDKALLSKRYFMALDTLVWATGMAQDHKKGKEYGFPSISTIYADRPDFIHVKFLFDGVLCKAASFAIEVDDYSRPYSFGARAALGELGEKLTARSIAEALVSRVIADLAAQDKEAK